MGALLNRCALSGVALSSGAAGDFRCGRQIFGTWEITRRLLEDRANGIQDAIWNTILERGNDTIVDIENWEKSAFEGVISRHPKAIIKFAG